MQNLKVHGLSEIMLFHCDMDKDELFQTAVNFKNMTLVLAFH